MTDARKRWPVATTAFGWSRLGPDASAEDLQGARAHLQGSWELVQASSDAALLSTLVDIIQAQPGSSASATGGGICKRETALDLLADLAAHSIHPNIVRRLLGLFTATAEPAVLGALCSAIARRESTEAFPGAAPGRFFCFRGAALSPLPQLHGPYFGRDAFSLWLWLRIDPDGGREEGGVLPQAVCAFVASTGYGIELSLRGAGVRAGGHCGTESGACGTDPAVTARWLNVSVTSSKGVGVSVRCNAPLQPGVWHFVTVDLTAAPRRAVWPFESAVPTPPPPYLHPDARAASLTSLYAAAAPAAAAAAASVSAAAAHSPATATTAVASSDSGALLMVHIDATPQLQRHVPFPAPTKDLRHWAVGMPVPHSAGGSSRCPKQTAPVFNCNTRITNANTQPPCLYRI